LFSGAERNGNAWDSELRAIASGAIREQAPLRVPGATGVCSSIEPTAPITNKLGMAGDHSIGSWSERATGGT